MRQSVGTTWIFSICLTFIVLFTAYLAVSVNYAKAFKIKNRIMDTIEESEGYTAALEQNITEYLGTQGYTASGICPDYSADDWQYMSCLDQNATGSCGACIYKTEITSNDQYMCAHKTYYKVVVFFKFDLPIVSHFSSFRVSGESKPVIDFANSSDACKNDR